MSVCFPQDFVTLVGAGDVTSHISLYIYDVIASSLCSDKFRHFCSTL